MSVKNFFRSITPAFIWQAAHTAKTALHPSPAPDAASANQPESAASSIDSAPTSAFDGKHSQDFWTNRDDETSSAAPYWESRTHPLRDAIAKAVAELPGRSLLEVGTHAGPTMWAIAQRKNFERLAGTELSLPVLRFAERHLPESLGRPVELVQAAADNLPYPDKSFDVVVTCGVLVCVGPETIQSSLHEMLRVCRGYLVLSEPFSDNPQEASLEGRIDSYPNTSYWIRNYPAMLEGKVELISYEQLAPESTRGHMNSILVLKVL